MKLTALAFAIIHKRWAICQQTAWFSSLVQRMAFIHGAVWKARSIIWFLSRKWWRNSRSAIWLERQDSGARNKNWIGTSPDSFPPRASEKRLGTRLLLSFECILTLSATGQPWWYSRCLRSSLPCHAPEILSAVRSPTNISIVPLAWFAHYFYVACIKLIMNATNMCLIMLGYSSGSLHLAHADLHGGVARKRFTRSCHCNCSSALNVICWESRDTGKDV